jgi:hypothetical protein
LGYLTIKSRPSKTEFILDYPNTEVKMSMALRILESYFNSAQIAEDACKRLNKALTDRNPELVVNEFNLLLSYIPFNYFSAVKRDEYFYCSHIFTLFHALNLYLKVEKHGDFGLKDFMVEAGDQSWVIVAKVSHKYKDDQKLAAAAMKQIKEKKYDDAYLNPVLLGMAINDKDRAIKAWMCEGGQGRSSSHAVDENQRRLS